MLDVRGSSPLHRDKVNLFVHEFIVVMVSITAIESKLGHLLRQIATWPETCTLLPLFIAWRAGALLVYGAKHLPLFCLLRREMQLHIHSCAEGVSEIATEMQPRS